MVLGRVASKVVGARFPSGMEMKLLLSILKPPELPAKGFAAFLLGSEVPFFLATCRGSL